MLHKPILTQSKAWLLYVCLLTMLAGCSQCNKVVEPNDPTNPAGLPAATQVGARTFGCMVNGKVYVPVGRQSILTSNPKAAYEPSYGELGIGGDIYLDKPVNGSNLKEYISFSGQNIYDVGTYNLTNSNIIFIYANIAEDGNGYYSDTEIATNCQLTITKLDKTNKIIAGTFSFTLEKKDTGKKVTVTDGRFDLKYL